MTETFNVARARLLRELAMLGWQCAPTLKTPWAESPDREFRLWFKPQAVWLGSAGADIGAAYSLFLDIRSLTKEELIRKAESAWTRSSHHD